MTSSLLKPAQPATLDDFLRVAKAEADDSTLSRVVLECLMLARASAGAAMAYAWLNIAMRSVADWTGPLSNTTRLLKSQVLTADDDLRKKFGAARSMPW